MSLVYGISCIKNMIRIAKLLINETTKERTKLNNEDNSINSNEITNNNINNSKLINCLDEKIKQLQIIQIVGYTHLCWIGLKIRDPLITIYFAKKAVGMNNAIAIIITITITITITVTTTTKAYSTSTDSTTKLT